MITFYNEIYIFFLFFICYTENTYSQSKEYDKRIDSLTVLNKIVNDFEDVLTETQEKYLIDELFDYESKSTNEIVIVTIADFKPYDDIFQFSLDLANRTGVGKVDKNNGILIILSKNRRQIQIQNGDGIVPLFSNEQTKYIIQEIMIPEFKKDDYFEGLKKGLSAIMKILSK